ncbi:MAG: methylated-DNA--[protein]-cysteine S-methyltransferase [Proteobacteria bacterium]|nr:methylated-DNA--[protein]-cysteine S-methyltransferase [Pseudomonadota bacterium]MBS0217300.1 methylated-DNA--[protein]-cysteine S-methyltransferase [Pseudomonadota bacterium]
MKADIVHWLHVPSPVGQLLVAADDDGLRAIEFPRNRHPVKRDDGWIEASHRLIDEAQRQLDDYFAGKRTTFTVPLAPRGTPFQLAVWNALREIPFGDTWSYGDLARHIDQPSAVRAVGAANGRNPIPIIVPCHRVIGSDGTLTGFGGGLPTKEFLLRLEGALPASLL